MLEKVSAIDIRRNADFGVDYCHGSIQYDENWETVQKFIGNETQSTFVKKFPSKPVETRRNIRTLAAVGARMRRERQFSIDALKHKQTQSMAVVESPPEPAESVQNVRNPAPVGPGMRRRRAFSIDALKRFRK